MDKPPDTSKDKKPGPRTVGQRLRRVLLLMAGIPIAVIVLLVALDIPVSLEFLKARIESAAGESIGREVRIDGPLFVTASMRPTAQIERVRISSPDGWQGEDLAALDLARLRLGLLPLLGGEIHVLDATVSGATLNFESTAEGQKNWVLGPNQVATDSAPAETASGAGAPEPQSPSDDPTIGRDLPLVTVDTLHITDVAVHRRELGEGEGEGVTFRIDEVIGAAAEGEPITLDIKGRLQTAPYSIAVNGGSIDRLLESADGWPLTVSAQMVGATLGIEGKMADPLAGQGLQVKFDVGGPNLAELGALMDVQLPPLESFDLTGNIVQSDGELRLDDLAGSIVSSRVSGKFQADTGSAKPYLTGELVVESIDAGPLVAALQQAGIVSSPRELPPGSGSVNGSTTNDTVSQTGASGEVSLSALDLDKEVLVLDALSRFEADLKLTVKGVENLSIQVSDAVLAVKVHDGVLQAPMAVQMGGTRFTGELTLSNGPASKGSADANAAAGTVGGTEPQVTLKLQGKDGEFEQLFEILTGISGVQGRFTRTDIGFESRGDQLRELILSSRLTLEVDDAAMRYGNSSGKAPVEFTLARAVLALPLDDDITFEATGALLGLPYAVNLTAGSLAKSSETKSLPMDIQVEGGGATIKATGSIVRREQVGHIDIAITGERLGDLSTWVGVSEDASMSYEVNGALVQDETSLRARIDTARLGSTAISGEVGVRRDGETPIPFARLAVKGVDLEELASLAPPASEQPEVGAAQGGKEADGYSIDVPLLPTGISLVDADLEITMDRFPGGRLVLEDMSLTASSRNGMVSGAPFAVTVGGVKVQGEMGADLSGDTPALDLHMTSKDMKVGALLKDLGVAEGLDLTAHGFELDMETRGATVREVLKGSSFEARLTDAQTALGTADGVKVHIPRATVAGPAGEPIKASIEGRVNWAPIDITLTTDSLASFAEPKEALELRVGVQGQKTLLTLAGRTPLPLNPRRITMAMDLKSENLSALDQLLGTNLPPIGPFHTVGKFGTNDTGLYVQDMVMEVGSSRLTGKMDLNDTTTPPRLDVALVAETIQIDDFVPAGGFKDWSATDAGTSREAALDTQPPAPGTHGPRSIQRALVDRGFDTGGIDGKFGPKTVEAIKEFQAQQGLPVTGKVDPAVSQALLGAGGPTGGVANTARPTPQSTEELSGKEKDASDDSDAAAVRALLSPETLKRLNAQVTLDVQDVLSGKDRLGRGKASMALKDGTITLDPLTISIPEGNVDISLALTPGASSSRMRTTAKVDRLDYGSLARRIDPASKVGGLIWVDIDLTMQGPEGRMMAGSNGHFDVAVAPDDLNAGIFDLWAVNLVSALVADLDKEASKVNCIVARFAVKDGIMRPTAILIDSTRVQASGDGVVDFGAETVEFIAAPRPKTAGLFSAQPPIQAKGSFDDFRVGLQSGALIGSTVQMLASPVTAPLRWVFSKPLPADGREACIEAWRRSAAAPPAEPQ